MLKFRDLPIRLKLTVLLGASAAIALTISAVMSVSLTYITQRGESLRHLQQVSAIASENLTAALAFRDGASAGRMLGSLRANPQILVAIIHDDEAKQFSAYTSPAADSDVVKQYVSEGANLATARHAQLFEQRKGLESTDFDFMTVITPIVLEDKVIGTLTLVSDNLALKQKLAYYMLWQTLISILTLVIIAFISIWLQKVFTSPIFHLIDVIREISNSKNYAVSVSTSQKDEFGVLYTHFNDMIAEIRSRDNLLSRLATTDPLTGLANRRHAMEVMQTMVSRAHRKRESFGLVMFDVDNFKHVNDQFGHPVGDIVLKEVAAIMARAAREYDLVARIGGEEFLVLCDASDLETTRMIAERMRVEIESTAIKTSADTFLKATVSAGVFATVPMTEDTDVLLKIVDDALYHAKGTGRNNVVMGGSQ